MAPVYGCNICGTMCEYVSNLNRHLLTHELEAIYSCHCCNYTCNRKDNLNRHLDKYHSEMPNVQVARPLTQLNTDEKAPEYPMGAFDKRLQLPHNFIYAGASQSVSFRLLSLLQLLTQYVFRVKLLFWWKRLKMPVKYTIQCQNASFSSIAVSVSLFDAMFIMVLL